MGLAVKHCCLQTVSKCSLCTRSLIESGLCSHVSLYTPSLTYCSWWHSEFHELRAVIFRRKIYPWVKSYSSTLGCIFFGIHHQYKNVPSIDGILGVDFKTHPKAMEKKCLSVNPPNFNKILSILLWSKRNVNNWIQCDGNFDYWYHKDSFPYLLKTIGMKFSNYKIYPKETGIIRIATRASILRNSF